MILTKLLILLNFVFIGSASILKDQEKRDASEIEFLIETIKGMDATMKHMEANVGDMKQELDKTKMERKTLEVKMQNMETKMLNMEMKIQHLENTVPTQLESVKSQDAVINTHANDLKDSDELSKLLNTHSHDILAKKILTQLQKQLQRYDEKLNEIDSTVRQNVHFCGCSMATDNDATNDSGTISPSGKNNSVFTVTRGSINDKHNYKRERKSGSNTRQERQVPEIAAFSAYLDHDLENLGPNHVIPFKGVVLNEGNAYNQFTGVFVAPLPGVYQFSFFIEDYRSHRHWVKLVVDGKLISSIVINPIPAGNHIQGGNVVITRLTAGQSVWVAIDPNEDGNSLQGYPELRTTTFSGVFLYA